MQAPNPPQDRSVTTIYLVGHIVLLIKNHELFRFHMYFIP